MSDPARSVSTLGDLMRAGALTCLSLLGVVSLGSCVTEPAGPRLPDLADNTGEPDRRTVRQKLAAVGISLIRAEAAGIPAEEVDQVIACEVDPRHPNPGLPPHEAGYLLVGVNGRPCSAAKIRRALANWTRGRPARLVVRRNPYLQLNPEWWEVEVILALP